MNFSVFIRILHELAKDTKFPIGTIDQTLKCYFEISLE